MPEDVSPRHRNSVGEAAKVFQSLLFPKEGQDTEEDTTDEETLVDEDQNQDQEVETTDAGDGSPDIQTDEPQSDDDDDAQTPAPKKAKVKDLESGNEIEVDEDEAHLGYLRVQDYHRKTTNAANLRKQAEADLAAAREVRETYAQKLAEAEDWLNAIAPTEPNWAELRKKLTPEKYAEVHAQWSEVSTVRAGLQAEKEKVEKARQEEFVKQAEARFAEEQEKLLEALPAWLDPKIAKREQAALETWLTKQGYTRDQILSIDDHRLILALRNAMLYEQAQSASPPKPTRKPAGRAAPPGPSRSSEPKDARSRDMARLRKSGKMSDAAKVMLHFVD